MATPSGGRGDGQSAKSTVADQISQSVQSTSNLLRLMLDSSDSHAQLRKLPRNLLTMTSTIKNTKVVLEQLPQVISSMDTHVDRGLQSLPHLNTVIQLLSTVQSCQVKSLSKAQLSEQILPEMMIDFVGAPVPFIWVLENQVPAVPMPLVCDRARKCVSNEDSDHSSSEYDEGSSIELKQNTSLGLGYVAAPKQFDPP